MDSGIQETTKNPQFPIPTSLYWDRMKDVYRIFRFMGYIPYKINGLPEKMESSTRVWVWTVFIAFIQTGIIVIGNYLHMGDSFWKTYETSLNSVLRIMYTNTSVILVAFWFDNYKILKYVNDWTEFLSQLESVTSTRADFFSRETFRKVLLCSALFTIGMLILDQITTLRGFYPLLFLSYFVTIYVSAILTIFWMANCLFIVQIARHFKNNFFLVLSNNPDPSLLNHYRLLCLQLRQNAANLAEGFNGSIGIHILYNMISLTFSLYSWSVVVFNGNDNNLMIGFMIPLVWSLLTLTIICECSDMVAREIGPGLTKKLLSVNFVVLKTDSLPSEEIDLLMLIDILVGKSPDLVLHGFLTINRNLIIKMLSSIITYCIVLVQFRT